MVPLNGLTYLIHESNDETEIANILLENDCLSDKALADLAAVQKVVRRALDNYDAGDVRDERGLVVAFHLPVHDVHKALMEGWLSKKGVKLSSQPPPPLRRRP